MLRVAILAATVALTTAAPAAAQNLCHGQLAPKPKPTPVQREQADLEDWAAQRAQFGFRHDIAYVRKLVKAGVWEYDVGYIPVTRAENRYLKLRDELTLGPRAERYLSAHRDVTGGVSVEDDWPHEPYLLVRFTKDVARHEAEVRRLARYPHNLRGKRVRYSDRALDRIAKRIERDSKRLDAAGFHLTGVSGGGGADDTVEIEMITKRTD